MSLPLLKSMYAHLAWANARVLEALRAAPGDDPQSLERFAHILAAEHIWLSRIEGRVPRLAVFPVLTIEECAALSAENVEGYARLLEREQGDSLERTQTYTNSSGASFTGRVLDILTQVALHGSYHRGQVALMMRRSGGEPVSTDYILYVRSLPG